MAHTWHEHGVALSKLFDQRQRLDVATEKDVLAVVDRLSRRAVDERRRAADSARDPLRCGS